MTTILDGNNHGPAFLVRSNNVIITGFRIRNVENPPPNTDSLNRLAGIHLLGANNCKVFDNIAAGCGKGVWIYEGSGNHVFDNDFFANNYGIVLEATSQNVLSRNSAQGGWNGILLVNAEGNVLKNNLMHNNTCSFGVRGESASAYKNDVDISNLVDDKKLYYLNGLNSKTISPQTYPDLGALILTDSKDMTIQDLCINNSYSGIQLFNSENTKIANNTLQGNKYGIQISNCTDCTLFANHLRESNDTGINIKESINVSIDKNSFEKTGLVTVDIESCSGCSVVDNTFYGYHEYGIRLDSTNNTRLAYNGQDGTDMVMHAFGLRSSSDNRIESNRFQLCALALMIGTNSTNNHINNNSFGTERGSTGLTLHSANHNTISDNVFDNFHTGLKLANAQNNVIAKNTLTSREHAVELFRFSNNIFEDNRFLGAEDVWDRGLELRKETSVNIWK